MTTVAWDGEVLSADSRMADDTIEQCDLIKIYRVKNTLVGFAGAVSSGLRFVDWIRAGEVYEDRPKDLDSDFTGIVVRPNGKAFEFTKDLYPVPSGTPTAIGSGRAYALGAMLAGASSKKAVEVTKKLDSGTGGPVRSLRLIIR